MYQLISAVIVVFFLAGVLQAEEPEVVYLSYLTEHIAHASQEWGELGFDVAAHEKGRPAEKLRIGEAVYKKGLGTHAHSEIVVELDGRYERFESDIGVQAGSGKDATVHFSVFVDDRQAYHSFAGRDFSGIMKDGQSAKSISVDLRGAQQLRLVVGNGYDTNTGDRGNWANARLIPAAPDDRPTGPHIDVGRFARLASWDPKRKQGITASRMQEIPAEELFLSRNLTPDVGGVVNLPAEQGEVCIGLAWPEPRRLGSLELTFAHGSPVPEPADVQVECWLGESVYQGKWVPLEASIQRKGRSLTAPVNYRSNNDLRPGTRQVRWILPTSTKPYRLARPVAMSQSRWKTVEIDILQEPHTPPQRIDEIACYNGEFLVEGKARTRLSRQPGENRQRIKLRTCNGPWSGDRTRVTFRSPAGGFAVAVEDLLENGPVYVPYANVLISRVADGGEPLTIDAWRKSIAGRKTILQRIRAMPDQTLAQALKVVHNPVQNNGPVMLSLAAGSAKFIAHHNGATEYPGAGGFRSVRIRPLFGRNAVITSRHLDGGWLPAPVLQAEQDGVRYTQRTYVAPVDIGRQARPPLRAEMGSLGVQEYTIETDKPEGSAFRLDLLMQRAEDARVEAVDGGWVFCDDKHVQALLDTPAGQAEVTLLGPDVEIEETIRFEDRWDQPKPARGTVRLRGRVEPGKPLLVRVRMPGWPLARNQADSLPREGLFETMRDYWRGVLSHGARIELPDPLLDDILRASQVHCLMACRGGGSVARDGSRFIQPWASSTDYGPIESECNSFIYGMLLLGHDTFARECLNYYRMWYTPAGFIHTEFPYTLMGTGWHLWTVGRYARLTDDREWLRAGAPGFLRLCRWIARQREKTMHLDEEGRKVPQYGLMPPGAMADWGAYGYSFCLNGYFCAGLREAARAMADVHIDGAAELAKTAETFADDIRRSYQWTRDRYVVLPLQNGTSVRGYPSRVFAFSPLEHYFPDDVLTYWGYEIELGAHHLATQGILDPRGEEVTRMIEQMEDGPFLEDGLNDYPAERRQADWFNLGGFARIQPYYCRIAEIYALRDEVKPFLRAYFNMLATLLNRETLTFWECFNNFGAWNKTHETGYFLQQTRFMLALEEDDALHLTRLCPQAWFEDGKVLRVEGLPTPFGKVGFRIESHVDEGFIEARVDPPARSKPSLMTIRFRHPRGGRLRAVFVNGKPYKAFEPDLGIVRLPQGNEALSVRACYDENPKSRPSAPKYRQE